MSRSRVAIVLAGSLGLAATVQAQVTVETRPPLAPGDTVRVWATAPLLNGTVGGLSRLDGRDLTMTNLAEAAPLTTPPTVVPLNTLRRLDVRRGMHRSVERTVIGVVLGAAGGALIGAALGPVIECRIDCNQSGSLQGIVGFFIGAGVGGVAGGITGGVIGARKRPKWESVRLGSR
jgi:hypothetical protein